MKTRIAINGFGRIGRMLTRILTTTQSGDHDLVAINDIWDIDTMANLLKYDSVHGRYPGTIEVQSDQLILSGQKVKYTQCATLEELDWSASNVDLAIDCTGLWKDATSLGKHLTAGAKRVIQSAPTQDTDMKMIVYGVNHETLTASDQIISCASCTTNNAAPMIALIDELCEIDGCYITTVHSYTGDQRLHDAPHKDWRRGRAATESIVPTTTGAAKALTGIFPHLNGVMGGCGIRVPVPDGSLTDITCTVKKPMSAEALNSAFAEAAKQRFSGVLDFTRDSIVSRDIIGNSYSCTVDAQLTSVIGNMVKVVGWYDNEVGYSHRIIDVLRYWTSLSK